VPSQLSDEVVNPYAKRIGHNLQSLDGHVALPALDLPDMGAIEAGTVGEYILRPTAFLAVPPDRCADFFLNILHS
jgi:hypothetical protein